jgi:hypothetical protein
MGHWLFLLLIVALGIWKLVDGEPLWLVPLAIAGFVEWFMVDRPANEGRPSHQLGHDPQGSQPPEHPPAR